MPESGSVHEMRLVVTATDYDEAVRFYRDVLGMPMREAYESPDGRVTILEAGVATLEIADPEPGRVHRPGRGRVAGWRATSGSPSQVDDSVGDDANARGRRRDGPRRGDADALGLAQCPARPARPACSSRCSRSSPPEG